jgi:hypothetical protein
MTHGEKENRDLILVIVCTSILVSGLLFAVIKIIDSLI